MMPALKTEVKKALVKRCGSLARTLHDRNIVHADLHSWNILCNSKCKLFLIDFDKSARSSQPGHQLHDLGMFLDTIDPQFWYVFMQGYHNDPEAQLPFDFSDALTTSSQKKRLHETSRHLFSLYVNDLRNNKLQLL